MSTAAAALAEIDTRSFAAWLDSLRGAYPDDDIASFRAAHARARELAGNALARDGDPLVRHAAGTASIVAALKLDAATVRAALLLGLPSVKDFDGDAIAQQFG